VLLGRLIAQKSASWQPKKMGRSAKVGRFGMQGYEKQKKLARGEVLGGAMSGVSKAQRKSTKPAAKPAPKAKGEKKEANNTKRDSE